MRGGKEREKEGEREKKREERESEKEREKFPYRLTVGVARVFNRLPGVHSEIPSVNYADFQCIQTPWNFYDCLTAALPYATGGEICTTEIFQGFNFINDHPVPAACEQPDDPCSIDLSPLWLFRLFRPFRSTLRARHVRGAPVGRRGDTWRYFAACDR